MTEPVGDSVQSLSTGRKTLWAILLMLVGCAAAAYIHWPALTNPLEYKSDFRQSPHWVAYHTDTFRDDDLLLTLARHNESPLQNLIYYLGTFFVDAVSLGKWLAVIGYGLTSALFFWLAHNLFGLRAGILAALAFTFLPDQFEYWAGGFSKAWMIPIILVCLYTLERREWRGLLLLMPFAAVAYPVSAVMTGALVFAFVLLEGASTGRRALPAFWALCGASALALTVLCFKYLFPPAGIGTLTPGRVLRSMPEMYREGLYPYLPLPPLLAELNEHLGNPFVLLSAITFMVVLGRERVWWSRTMTALVIASLVFYLLASELFMNLYQPNRYTRYSIAVLMALWHGRNWDLVAKRIPWRPVQGLVLGVVLALGAYWFHGGFYQGKDTSDRSRFAPLSQFLSSLPAKVLIAGHPMYMDDIPIQARRSVLCNYKLAHPWYSEFYLEMRSRTHATFDAYYAEDAATVNRLAHDYGVTHLVVVKRHIRRERVLARNVYVKPYNEYIYEIAKDRRRYLLATPPRENIVYETDELYVLELPIGQAKGSAAEDESGTTRTASTRSDAIDALALRAGVSEASRGQRVRR